MNFYVCNVCCCLDLYETGAIEGVEEDEVEDEGALSAETTEPPLKRGRGRPPKPATEAATPTAPGSVAANLSGPMQQMLMKMGLLPSMIHYMYYPLISARNTYTLLFNAGESHNSYVL